MDSLKKRYFVKLISSGSDALINLLLLLFVPRALGPAAYGNFNFIRELFQNIVSFSDLNLGSAHINHAARKNHSALATSVYFSYTLLLGLLLLFFIVVITVTGLSQYIFPGQSKEYLYLGGLLAYLMYLFSALMGLSDSKAATFGFELRGIIVKVILFFVLLALYLADDLDLTTFFSQRIALFFALLLVGVWYLHKAIGFSPYLVNPLRSDVRAVLHEFFSFSHPLIAMAALGLLFGIFDRWFLQVIYGSESQGFFSLAYSLSAVAGLFLAPMTPLLMQSVAYSDERGNREGVRSAFEKVKFFYLIGAFLSIFFMFHTREIIGLVGGSEYDAAQITILVMFLYPIHVVYGQFCGGVLIALRKTALYRNIGLITTLAGIGVTYFLLAPQSFPVPGLGLGSLGLAWKVVLIQFLSVNVMLYFVCKVVGENFSSYLISQLLIPLPLIILGGMEWLVRQQLAWEPHGGGESMLSLGGAMILWGGVMVGIIWAMPALVGLNKSTLQGVVDLLSGALKNKKYESEG